MRLTTITLLSCLLSLSVAQDESNIPVNSSTAIHVALILDSIALVISILIYCLCLRHLKLFKRSHEASNLLNETQKRKNLTQPNTRMQESCIDDEDEQLFNDERVAAGHQSNDNSDDNQSFDNLSNNMDDNLNDNSNSNMEDNWDSNLNSNLNDNSNSNLNDNSNQHQSNNIPSYDNPNENQSNEMNNQQQLEQNDTSSSDDDLHSNLKKEPDTHKHVRQNFYTSWASATRGISILWNALYSDESYIRFSEMYGHQVAVYLWLTKQIVLAFFTCSVLGLTILLPLHLNGSLPLYISKDTQDPHLKNTKRNFFLIKTTVSMVVHNPNKLYVHVAMSLIFILVFLAFLYRFTNSRLILDYPFGKILISQYSARLSQLPVEMTDRSLLTQICNSPELFSETVLTSRISFNTSKRIRLEKKYQFYKTRLEHYKEKWEKTKTRPKMPIFPLIFRILCCCCGVCLGPPCCRSFCFGRCHRDAISYYEKKVARASKKAQQWDEAFLKKPTSTGSAYLLFHSRQDTDRMIRDSRGILYRVSLNGPKKPESMDEIHFSVGRAAEPSDILWENSQISRESRKTRIVFVNILMLLFLLIFTFPLPVISSFQSFTALIPRRVSHELDTLRNMSGWIGSFIYQYVPTLLLLILNSSLPYIIPIFTRLERHYTYSNASSTTLYRLFTYLLITSLIMPTMALSSMDGLLKYLQLKDFRRSLQSLFLPGSGIFFFNLCIQYIFWGIIIDLLRVSDLLRYFYKRWISITPEEKAQAEQLAEFDLPIEYGFLMSFFAVCVTYSVFSPLFLLMGLIYFMCKFFIDIHNIVHLCDKNPSSRHRGLIDESNYLHNIKIIAYVFVSCIIAFEVFMIFFFAKAGSMCYVHLSIMIFALLATGVYIAYWSWTFQLTDASHLARVRGTNRESLMDEYRRQSNPLDMMDDLKRFSQAYVPPHAPIDLIEEVQQGTTLEQEGGAVVVLDDDERSAQSSSTQHHYDEESDENPQEIQPEKDLIDF